MIPALLLLVVALCVVLAGWAGWFVARDRAVILNQLWGGAVIEFFLLVQGVVAIVQGAGGGGARDAGERRQRRRSRTIRLPHRRCRPVVCGT